MCIKVDIELSKQFPFQFFRTEQRLFVKKVCTQSYARSWEQKSMQQSIFVSLMLKIKLNQLKMLLCIAKSYKYLAEKYD